jgi:hypothetical protein
MEARFEAFNPAFRFTTQDRRALRQALAAKQDGVLVDLQRKLRALRIVHRASTTRRVKPSAYAFAATTVRRALNRLPLIDSASRAVVKRSPFTRSWPRSRAIEWNCRNDGMPFSEACES